MNKNKELYFKTNALGELRILSFIDNTALLEKMYDSLEKYIIAINFDIQNCCWNSGIYHTSFKDAFDEYREIVYINKHISLSEKESNYEQDITDNIF